MVIFKKPFEVEVSLYVCLLCAVTSDFSVLKSFFGFLFAFYIEANTRDCAKRTNFFQSIHHPV